MRLSTTGRVILWWELHRLVYNAVLLVIGGATVTGYEWLMTKLIPLGEDAIEPMGLVVLVVLYGATANLWRVAHIWSFLDNLGAPYLEEMWEGGVVWRRLRCARDGGGSGLATP